MKTSDINTQSQICNHQLLITIDLPENHPWKLKPLEKDVKDGSLYKGGCSDDKWLESGWVLKAEPIGWPDGLQ